MQLLIVLIVAPGVNKTRDESPPFSPSPVGTREKEVKFDLNPQEQEISPNPSPERSDENRNRHRERRDDTDSDDERHGSDRNRDKDRDQHRRRHADERSNGSQGSGAIANDTGELNLLGLIPTPPSNFLHDLTRRGVGKVTIQWQTNWKVFCSLCFGSGL